MSESAVFAGTSGLEEVFLAMTSVPNTDFLEEAGRLLLDYRAAAARHNCGPETEVLLRFHLSDITNQAPLLRRLLGPSHGLTVMIGQPPVGNARLALEAWHWRQQTGRLQLSREDDVISVQLENYRWLGFRTAAATAAEDSAAQTRDTLEQFTQELERRGGKLSHNALRTWFYCRDIDNNYAGLVEARRNFFTAAGLTENTHYLASTGIEGQAENPRRLVHLDALALFGHRAEQLEYLRAPDFLPPTHRYGVTFERGTRILYGDRSHYFISGTASIDRDGHILHPGQVAAQSERMVANVAALLERHRAALTDLKLVTVYLRDAADAPVVEKQLRRLLPDAVPRVLLKGTVCRPGWLVEMDAIGVNARGNPDFAPFR